MENKPSKINYEPEADVLSFELNDKPIDFAKEIGNIVVHFTKNNLPVYIEILEATKFVKQTSKLVGQARSLSLRPSTA